MTSPDSTVRSTIWKDGMEYRISASKNDFTYIENGNLGISIQDMENLYRSIKSVKGPFPKQELVAEKELEGRLKDELLKKKYALEKKRRL